MEKLAAMGIAAPQPEVLSADQERLHIESEVASSLLENPQWQDLHKGVDSEVLRYDTDRAAASAVGIADILRNYGCSAADLHDETTQGYQDAVVAAHLNRLGEGGVVDTGTPVLAHDLSSDERLRLVLPLQVALDALQVSDATEAARRPMDNSCYPIGMGKAAVGTLKVVTGPTSSSGPSDWSLAA